MRKILQISLLLFYTIGFGQSISNQVISSLGLNTLSVNLAMDGTLGETLYQGGQNNNIVLTEGFIQPNQEIILSIDSFNDLSMTIFPNPVFDFLNIQLTNMSIMPLKLEIFNVNGKLIKTNSLTEKHSRLDLSILSTGTYLVRFVLPRTDIKTETIKLIKL